MCNKYNGWTNYETWNYNLWNDFSDEFENRAEFLAFLESDIQERIDALPSSGFENDIFTAALQAINVYEIASHYFDE